MAKGLARMKATAVAWSSTRKCSGMYKLHRFLLSNVQQLFHFGNHRSLLVFHFHFEDRLVLRQHLQLLSNVIELALGESELGPHRALPRLAVTDARSLVPDNVIASKFCHHHEHIESVGHGKERSAEMGADIVGIPPA